MARGVNWASVTENSVEWRSPTGTKHPVRLVSKVDTDPLAGQIVVEMATPLTVTRDHNGDWYVWSTDSSVLDLDGEPFSPNTRIDATKQTINIPEAPVDNQPPVIAYTGTALVDITTAGVENFSITLDISDPA